MLDKAWELGLDVVGVSFHVGSGCYDPSVYADAIKHVWGVFDLAREYGYVLMLLDVGGGFEEAMFERPAECLRGAIEEWFSDRRESGMRIVAEPRRYYVANVFKLATNIIACRAPTAPAHPDRLTEDGKLKVMCKHVSFLFSFHTPHNPIF